MTAYNRRLDEVFLRDDELAICVARLSVLFEDLRLEVEASSQEPLPRLEVLGKSYRYFYFLRRMVLSIDEFVSAVHALNACVEWKRLRRSFDSDTEARWSQALKYLLVNRQEWSRLRDAIGGHFQQSAAAYAVNNLRPGTIGTIEIVENDDTHTGGVRLQYATHLVGAAIKQALGPGDHTDDEIRAYANRLFTVVIGAVNEAVKIADTIALVYTLDLFR